VVTLFHVLADEEYYLNAIQKEMENIEKSEKQLALY